jgi:methylglutaconyl-CoA hydratase
MRRAADFTEAESREDALRLAAMLRSVATCRHPVVARVQGAALGGGAGLVAAADIAVAGESATFGFTEVRLGLLPATIAPHVVDKIGPGRALPLFLTGERFDAARALAIGLVHRVVKDSDLDAEVDSLIEALAAGGAAAHAKCKELVQAIAATPRGEIDQITSAMIASARSSAEGREGVRAFLEKRKPNWVEADGR